VTAFVIVASQKSGHPSRALIECDTHHIRNIQYFQRARLKRAFAQTTRLDDLEIASNIISMSGDDVRVVSFGFGSIDTKETKRLV
jgi:hypothetical protein